MAVIKEKKRSVQLECQGCQKRVWVKRGTLCHRTDLCDICVKSISAHAWAKIKEAGEQENDSDRRKENA